MTATQTATIAEPKSEAEAEQVRKQLDRQARAAAPKPIEREAMVVENDPSQPAHLKEIVEPDGRVRYVSR